MNKKTYSADYYEKLATKYYLGEKTEVNCRLAAYYAVKAYETDEKYSKVLGTIFLFGDYFSKVIPFSKYLFKKAGYSDAELDERHDLKYCSWKDIKEIKPVFPPIDDEIRGFFTESCPFSLLIKAVDLHSYFTDEKIKKEGTDLLLYLASRGYPKAMSYFALSLDDDYEKKENEEYKYYLFKCIDDYFDLEAIDRAAVTYTKKALEGNYQLEETEKFWDMRDKYHPFVPMDREVKKYSDLFIKEKKRREKLKYVINDDCNALIITQQGELKREKIDFSTDENLKAPIKCESISIILNSNTEKISKELEFNVVGYFDALGLLKSMSKNNLIEKISGYGSICSDVVLCGFENKNYIPLNSEQLYDLTEYIKKHYFYLDNS